MSVIDMAKRFVSQSDRDMEATKGRAWRNDRVLLIRDNDPRLTWAERMAIKEIGDRLYGPDTLATDKPEGTA